MLELCLLLIVYIIIQYYISHFAEFSFFNQIKQFFQEAQSIEITFQKGKVPHKVDYDNLVQKK